MWKVLILLLKIIAHEPDIVMLAVGRQRQPGRYSRLLNPLPTDPWWQRCCFVWGLLCLIWLWEWLLELLVGFLLLSSETLQWNWSQLLKILTTIWLVSFLPQSWNVRAECLKMSLSIITVNSKIPDYFLKCQT